MELNVSENTFLCQSSLLKVVLNCLSIRRLLQQQILSAAMESGLTLEKIPVHRLSRQTNIIYRCAIAPRLAAWQKKSPQEIANQLVTHLLMISQEMNEQPQLDFTVRIIQSGWIDFYLSDRALAVWLQQLLEVGSRKSEVKPLRSWGLPKWSKWRGNRSSEVGKTHSPFPIPHTPFPIQYAHARCCSLLRLGHRENLIQLHDPNFSQPTYQWVNPIPIPWLSSSPSEIQLVHPAEKQLIEQLLTVVDKLEDSREGNWVQLAMNVTEAFLEFEGSCRIFGEVKQKTRELAQARLGLIAVTQVLLRSLLQQIGVAALTEL